MRSHRCRPLLPTRSTSSPSWRRGAALAVATAAAVTLAACSPDTGGPGSPAPPAAAGADRGLPGAGTAAGAGPAEPGRSDAVGRFLACLAAGGVTARSGIPDDPTTDGLVFVQVDEAPADLADGVGVVMSSAGANVADLPDELRHLILGTMDATGSWQAATGAAHFEATGLLAVADVYAACEAAHPEFVQAQWEPMDEAQWREFVARHQQAGLAFARDARAAGLAWVADPVEEQAGMILLPPRLTEAEFRAAIELAVENGHDELWFRLASDADVDFDVSAVVTQIAGPDAAIMVSVG